jgi:hypothetical protein
MSDDTIWPGDGPRKRRHVGPQVFICDLGYYEGMPMVAARPLTPDCEPHTPRPEGYVAWWEWADLMAETHTQRRCKGCEQWAIWERLTTAENSASD